MVYLVGWLSNGDEVVGATFIIVDGVHRVRKNVSLTMIWRFIDFCRRQSLQIMNFDLDPDGNLKATSGSNNSYGVVNTITNRLMSKPSLTFLYAVLDDKTGDRIGFGVTDAYGVSLNIRLKKAISLSNKYKFTNVDVYTKQDGSLGIRSKVGDLPTVQLTEAKVVRAVNSKGQSESDVEIIQKENDAIIASRKNVTISSTGTPNCVPMIVVNSLVPDETIGNNLDYQAAVLIAKNNLAKVNLYFATLLETVRLVPTKTVPTLAASEDTIFYNTDFVVELSTAELTYVLIHELLHIAMSHSLRSRGRQHMLWNIATDLYINEYINNKFGLTRYGRVVSVSSGGRNSGYIKSYDQGVFLDNFRNGAGDAISLDLSVDTPEGIYMELVTENPDFNNMGGGSDDDSSQSDSQSPDGTSSSNSPTGQKQECDQTSGASGSSKSLDSSDKSGQSNNSDGSSDQSDGSGGDSGQYDNSDYSDGNSCGTGNSTLGNDANDVDNSEGYKSGDQPYKVKMKFRGQEIEVEMIPDILSNSGADGGHKAKEDTINAMQKMKTNEEIKKQQGKMIGGHSDSCCERHIDFALSMKYDWKSILYNFCKREAKKIYTLGSPNTDYMNMGITVASRRKVGTVRKIDNIKFCMDVSGSVSDGDIAVVCTKIKEILTRFDAKAEMIYWDTEVRNVGDFSSVKELLAIKPMGGGGTDVDCVFDYLCGVKDCNGHYEETKARDISAIMIFTDGAFSVGQDVIDKYQKNLGVKTIWVVNDGCSPFTPPFGMIATGLNS